MGEIFNDSWPLCYINGKKHVLPGDSADITLLHYLRTSGLTGTKLGCGQGGCGSCTVMISSYANGKVRSKAVNACLYPLYAVDNTHVITVEGNINIASSDRLTKFHGSQCGFCTPGFVMSMFSLLKSSNEKTISERDIEECISGNLCRCTGYRPILDAFKIFADHSHECAEEGIKNLDISIICPNSGLPCGCSDDSTENPKGTFVMETYDKDLNFPHEFRERQLKYLEMPGSCSWYRPVTLDQLLNLKSRFPNAPLIMGNTKLGTDKKNQIDFYKILISPTHIPELNHIDISETGVTFGVAVTMSVLRKYCMELRGKKESYRLESFEALARQLRWFGGVQIRNVATLGGHINSELCTSDVNPLLMAAGAEFFAINTEKIERSIQSTDFFIREKNANLNTSEILLKVKMPFTEKYEYVREFKQSKRRESDIAIITAGMRVKFSFDKEQDIWHVEDATIAFGNVAPNIIRAVNVEKSLLHKEWNLELMKAAMLAVKSDVNLEVGSKGVMCEYRNALAMSFLFKFLLEISKRLSAEPEIGSKILLSADFENAVTKFDRPLCKSVQFYPEPVEIQKSVGQSTIHQSADIQVTGEAVYTDDIKVTDCLHAAVVLSTCAHGHILSVNFGAALALNGVHGYYCYKDIPGSNETGVFNDEEIFAKDTVTCIGQVIGLVVAETQAIAKNAASLVNIEYDPLPPILTIEDAIENKSYFEFHKNIECGDVDAEMANIDHVLEGEGRCGAQEHFYLETNNCIVVPVEKDEFIIYGSIQNPYDNQVKVAKALGIPENKIVCKTKRIGGGFGGKETRTTILSTAAAVAAYHLNRPIRLCFDRDTDMQVTGQRHPFYARFKVGFSCDGKITALDLKLYSNAGNSRDLSEPVMTRALHHADVCYKIGNFRGVGYLCKTNLPSNTAFRGFGGPQAMLLMEMCVEKVAHHLCLPSEKVREINMYAEGDITHFGQSVEASRIHSCWNGVLEQSEYLKRKAEIQEFNQNNKLRKRGICVVPTKFGIAFLEKFMNQAGALVHVYTDGTVLVTHGGVEMGQGLHTKICQITADALDIPLDSIHISETSTDKVANSIATAASVSTDIYGAAVLDACNQINSRLLPLKSKYPEKTFKEICKTAFLNRINLSAHGFHKTPNLTRVGGNSPFSYFTYGSACAEVELDILTGDWHNLRTDIVMDVGNPINPAIDIGQIEGAFVQGMGWLCLEEVIYGDSKNNWIPYGQLYSCGPGLYKIPTVNDIPIDFRIKLLSNVPNTRTIHSSKAIGEPPLSLSNSVFFALKNAVAEARRQNGKSTMEWFDLEAPCTPEKLCLACGNLKQDDFCKILCSL